MKSAVDTNILFDLLAGDSTAIASARSYLAKASSEGPVVICPVVYAELAAGFPNQDETRLFLHDLEIPIDNFSADSLFQAADAWKRYVAGRGNETQCPKCGQSTTFRCPSCKAALSWRQHIITDFLIGGHAFAQADRLLTRDRGYYRTYFPGLRIEGSIRPLSAG